MITIDFSKAIATVERLERRLNEIQGFMNEAGPLMKHWERIIEEDNRQGVLSGTDKDGNPAPPLQYRMSYHQRKALYKGTGDLKPIKPTIQQRLGQRPNLRRGQYAGKGNYATWGLLENNNLTSTAYRKLDGPRLAPRRQFSRVVTNLRTTSFQTEDKNVWIAQGAWRDVVSPKGVHFLPYHFDGSGNNPKYDLRGVRRSGVNDAKAAIIPWAKDVIRRLWRSVS